MDTAFNVLTVCEAKAVILNPEDRGIKVLFRKKF